MKTVTSTLVGLFMSTIVVAQTNQQKLFPKAEYPANSLGRKLQNQFGKHLSHCQAISKILPVRDYIPSDIKNYFHGEELSSTEVEAIAVNGSSLLRYVFLDSERNALDQSIFTTSPNSFLNAIPDTPQDYDVVNSRDFRSFLYTANCARMVNLVASGKGKSGAAALSAAVDVDNKRNMSLYAYEGVFKSPLNSIINDKNSKTTELMLNLWQFYLDHRNYVDKAYFLKEFRGLTVGRTMSSEQYRNLETTVGINVSTGVASVNINGSSSFKTNDKFVGTDFETFLYKKITDNYKQEDMFGKLPSPNDIVEYFKIPSVYNVSYIENNELMSEGNIHTIYLNIDGIPQSFINAGKWKLSQVNADAYEPYTAELTNVYKIHGKGNSAQFVITGVPNKKHFSAANPAADILVSFSIQSSESINGKSIEIPFNKNINTTEHPIPQFNAESVTRNFAVEANDKFSLFWKIPINFIDEEKAVNYNLGKTANVVSMELLIDGIKANAKATLICIDKRTYELSISTLDKFPMNLYTVQKASKTAVFKGIFKVPLVLGGTSQKSIEINLDFPDKIKKTEAEFISTSNGE